MNKLDAQDTCDTTDLPSLGFVLHHANRVFTRMLDSELRPLGVTSQQLGLLILMEQSSGPILQRDLVKRSATAQPAMVAAVKLLVRDGMLVQQPSPEDGRATVLELTKKGRKVVEHARPVLDQCNSLALAGVPAERARDLIELITEVTVNIRRINTEP